MFRALLRRNRIPAENVRSKSWDEFATGDAPPLDFVFTVCDNAAHEVCPVWPGQPITAHWGIHDPATVEGTDEEKARAFNKASRGLDARPKIFTSLRLDLLDRMALQRRLDDIGKLGTNGSWDRLVETGARTGDAAHAPFRNVRTADALRAASLEGPQPSS